MESYGQRSFRRWYDKYQHLSELIGLTEDLPLTVQEHIGESLISNVARFQSRIGGEGELRSLGSDVVLTFYKSYKKQRWYDTIPQMHKAMNMMIVLPDPILQHLDRRIAPLVEYIRAQKEVHRLNPAYVALKVDSYLETTENIELRDSGSHVVRQHRPGQPLPPKQTRH